MRVDPLPLDIELPAVVVARQHLQPFDVGRVDNQLAVGAPDLHPLAIERDVVLVSQLHHTIHELSICCLLREQRELLDGVLELVVVDADGSNTVESVGHEEENRELDQLPDHMPSVASSNESDGTAAPSASC